MRTLASASRMSQLRPFGSAGIMAAMSGAALMRVDGRRPDELRTVKITRNYIKHAEGSVLIEMGEELGSPGCGRCAKRAPVNSKPTS